MSIEQESPLVNSFLSSSSTAVPEESQTTVRHWLENRCFKEVFNISISDLRSVLETQYEIRLSFQEATFSRDVLSSLGKCGTHLMEADSVDNVLTRFQEKLFSLSATCGSLLSDSSSQQSSTKYFCEFLLSHFDFSTDKIVPIEDLLVYILLHSNSALNSKRGESITSSLLSVHQAIVDHTILLHSRIPSDIDALRKGPIAMRSSLLVSVVQLQSVIHVLDCFKYPTPMDDGNDGCGNAKQQQSSWLYALSLGVRHFIPIIAASVRLGLLICAIDSRYDVVAMALHARPHVRCVVDSFHVADLTNHQSGLDVSLQQQQSQPGSVQPLENQRVVHFYAISRAKAIEALLACAVGTFLLRPYDVNGAAAAATGESHRETPSLSGSGADGSSLYFLSFRCKDDEGVKHAVVRGEEAAAEVALAGRSGLCYRCGKIGPCSSLADLLRDISKVLPSGLLFDVLPAPLEELAQTPTKPTSTSRERRSSPQSLTPPESIDPNREMWQALRRNLGLAAFAPSTTFHTENVSIRRSMVHKSAHQQHYMTHDAHTEGCNFLQDPNISELYPSVVALLAVKAAFKQLSSCSREMSDAFSIDCTSTAAADYFLSMVEPVKAQQYHFYFADSIKKLGYQYWAKRVSFWLFSRIMKKFSPSLTVQPNFIKHVLNGHSSRSSSGSLYSIVSKHKNDASEANATAGSFVHAVESILSIVGSFILASERLIEALAVPKASPLTSVTTMHLRSGAFLADALINHIKKSIPLRIIKFPGPGSGGGHDHLAECMDPKDISVWLENRITFLTRTENRESHSRTPSPSSRSKQNAAGGHEEVIAVEGYGSDAGPVTPRGAARAAMNEKNLRRNKSVADSLRKAGRTAKLMARKSLSYDALTGIPKFKSLVGHVTTRKYGKPPSGQQIVGDADGIGDALVSSSNSFVRALFNHDEGLHGSTSSSNSLYASPLEFVTWLMEKGVLKGISRPPETAFHAVQLYYRYKDPWEVMLVQDSTAAQDPGRVGRCRYEVASSDIGEATMVTALSARLSRRSREAAQQLLQVLPVRGSMRGEAEQMVAGIGADQGVSFRQLWSELHAEAWLVSLVRGAHERLGREDEIDDGSGGRDHEIELSRLGLGRGGLDPFRRTISRHIYRNALFQRLHMPHRFIFVLQADIFGLKEVGTSSKDSFGFPSIAHSGSLEVYAVIRLSRSSSTFRKIDSQGNILSSSLSAPAATEIGGDASAGAALSSSSSSGSGATLLTNFRAPLDGSAVTNSHRADAVKSPSGFNGTEYSWREQAVFRFAAPEGIIRLSRASREEDHSQSQQQLGGELFVPPEKLVLSVYERTFFADTKIGDLELSLSALTDSRPFRDWLPLSSSPADMKGALASSTSSNWFVHVQMQLRTVLMALEPATSATPALAALEASPKPAASKHVTMEAASPQPGSRSVSPAGADKKGRGKKLLGMLEDLF